jgi:hypothetical protein
MNGNGGGAAAAAGLCSLMQRPHREQRSMCPLMLLRTLFFEEVELVLHISAVPL